MKYYEVVYPQHTTYVIQSDLSIDRFVSTFTKAVGFRGFEGNVVNTKTYLYINPVNNLSDGQKKQARILDNILIE